MSHLHVVLDDEYQNRVQLGHAVRLLLGYIADQPDGRPDIKRLGTPDMFLVGGVYCSVEEGETLSKQLSSVLPESRPDTEPPHE